MRTLCCMTRFLRSTSSPDLIPPDLMFLKGAIMGEPPGETYIAGELCSQCWGLGKTFGDLPTPLYLNILITGLTGECSGGNGKYVAKQTPGYPCHYDFSKTNYVGFLNFLRISTIVKLDKLDPLTVCIWFGGGMCSTYLTPFPVEIFIS